MVIRLQEGEAEGIVAAAAALGVADPVVEGALRRVDGACVFLDEAGRCRVHTTFGAAAKPAICRQYPLVRVRVGGGERWGIDPGCYRALNQPDAPELALPPDTLVAQVPGDEAMEHAVAGMLRGAPTVGAALGAMLGERPGSSGLPEGYLARWAARLAAVPWGELLPQAGTSAAEALAPLASHPWDNPGFSAPDPAFDADARDVVARLVELRLVQRTFGSPPAVVLVGLGGALAVYASTAPDSRGPALAAWTRVLRAPAMRTALIPDSATMGWLATGEGKPTGE